VFGVSGMYLATETSPLQYGVRPMLERI